MKKALILLTLLYVTITTQAQDKAYQIYNHKGKKVSYKSMIKELSKSDILLFGEYHNNPISHWLELEVTKSLAQTDSLILGSEIFERDNQDELQAYMMDSIDQTTFDSTARLWKNYNTDYKPLVDFAKTNKIEFVATNVPRRFASLVYKNGFEALDTLSHEQLLWIAPLPILYDSTLKCYQDMLAMMKDHGGSNLPKAQALKDATMANFILKHHNNGYLSLHFNGAYHSNNFEGIVWYIKQNKPSLISKTITTVSQSDITKLSEEYRNSASFIICVDEDMTTTY